VGLAVVLGLVLLLPGVARAAWDERAFAPAGPAPAPAGAARADRPQRIVLVTVDALRARSVDLAPGGRTPAFARLAAEATAFSHAHAVADATLFSMPTVLSGLSPRELEAARARWMHGRLGAAPSNALREGMLRGLPAQLAPAGYRSYYANKLIDPELVGMADEFAEGFAYAPISALDNGFNVRAFLPFDAIWRDLTHRRQPPADHAGALVENFARAEAYYRRPDPHAFIWLHLGVPHTPYRKIVRRPDGELSEADGPPVEFDAVAGADKQALAGFEGMYEDEVRYLDQELGRFLERLRGDPRWGATMLVLTADHGEAFQPGAEPHGTGVMSEDLTHVPLLIHAPGQRTGRVEPGLASGLDVVPTVLARTYNPPPAGFSGLALDRPIPPERMVGSWGLYPRALPGGEHAVAAYLGPYKYRRFYPDGREELVELPGERNVAAAHPAELARLRAFVARELPPARNGR
jgi:arylsulfatase A-like enzyme